MLPRIARVALAVVLLGALTLSSLAGPPIASARSHGPDVSIKVAGPARLKGGQAATYRIKATNVGNKTATNVSVSGGVPDAFNPISTTCPKGWRLDGGACVGKLGVGKSATIVFRVKVCCLFSDMDRNAWVVGAYSSPDFVDPTPADDWVSKPVRLTGPLMV